MIVSIAVVQMAERNIWFPQILNNELLIEADRMAPQETGGVLLGYVGKNNEYVVTHLIGPGAEATHSRFRFVPDYEYQQSEINRIFMESEGVSDYFGDWHTHPKGSCHISLMDRRTLQRIKNTPEVNVNFPLMVIACDGRKTWNVAAWKYTCSRWLLGADVEQLNIKIF